jgi:hypothetical protein
VNFPDAEQICALTIPLMLILACFVARDCVVNEHTQRKEVQTECVRRHPPRDCERL